VVVLQLSQICTTESYANVSKQHSNKTDETQNRTITTGYFVCHDKIMSALLILRITAASALQSSISTSHTHHNLSTNFTHYLLLSISHFQQPAVTNKWMTYLVHSQWHYISCEPVSSTVSTIHNISAADSTVYPATFLSLNYIRTVHKILRY